MLIPVLHRLLIKPDKVEESDEIIRRARAAGIRVELDKREEKAVEVGTVVAIGETAFVDFKAKTIPEIGDKVYFAKYAGKEVKENGESFLFLNDEDIIAIIKE